MKSIHNKTTRKNRVTLLFETILLEATFLYTSTFIREIQFHFSLILINLLKYLSKKENTFLLRREKWSSSIGIRKGYPKCGTSQTNIHINFSSGSHSDPFKVFSSVWTSLISEKRLIPNVCNANPQQGQLGMATSHPHYMFVPSKAIPIKVEFA